MEFGMKFAEGKEKLIDAATKSAEKVGAAAGAGVHLAKGKAGNILRSRTTHRLASLAVEVAVDGAFAVGQKYAGPAGKATKTLLGKKGVAVNKMASKLASTVSSAVKETVTGSVAESLNKAADVINPKPPKENGPKK